MLGRPNHPSIFIYLLFFFFGFFKNKIKYVIRAFWEEKKVKVVELPQFETLGGGVKCHILNFGSKSENV